MLIGKQLIDRARRLCDDVERPFQVDDDEMLEHLAAAEIDLAVTGRLLRQTLVFDTMVENPWVRFEDIRPGGFVEIKNPILVGWSEYNETTQETDQYILRYALHLQGSDDNAEQLGNPDDYDHVSLSSHQSPALRIEPPGRPKTIVLGEKTGYLRLIPAPDRIYSISIEAIVHPYPTLSNCESASTLPDRFHTDLPIGAALRAISGVDSELYDEKRYKQLQISWQQALMRARQEMAHQAYDNAPVKFASDVWS